MDRAPQEDAPDTRHLRMIALLSVVVLTLLLPLAAASAGPLPGDDPEPADPAPATAPESRNSSSAPVAAPTPTVSGSAPTARCGPELASRDGIEAQTCVLRHGGETWARTYYRNTTGEELRAALTFMGPATRTVQMHCTLTAHDEPGVCETPRERAAGAPEAYSAMAEFSEPRDDGPLLLRSGSN